MSVQSVAGKVKKHSAWSVFMGLLTAALGAFLIAYPLATGAITTVLLGWALIVGGAAQFVIALHSRTAGQFFWDLLLSLTYAVGGVALVFFPLAGMAALTGTLGALLIVQAVLVSIAAFQLRRLGAWGWLLVSAAVSLLLGIMILAQWPFSSAWAIGTLVGASVLVNGFSRVMVSLKIHKVAADVNRFAYGSA